MNKLKGWLALVLLLLSGAHCTGLPAAERHGTSFMLTMTAPV